MTDDMRIICTVKEFAEIIRGCDAFRNRVMNSCSQCPLGYVCNDGFVEQFVAAADVIEEAAKSEDHD